MSETLPQQGPRAIIRAGAWMFGAMLSFSAMAIGVRELHDTMGSFEIVFWRGALGLPVLLFLAWRADWQPMRTRRLGFHVFRNLIHFVGQFSWVVAVAMLPLAEVFAIEFTVPIWILIFATVFLGEKLTGGKLIAVAAGVTGILLIVRPGFEEIHVGTWIMLIGAVGFGAALTCTKSLTRTESPLTILIFMSIIQLPLGLIPAAFDWVNPTLEDVPFLAVIGSTGIFAHYCMARAFSLADATIAMPIDFLRLPFIAVVGFFLYDEALELWVLLGALIIFAGNYYNLQKEHRAATAGT